MFVHVAVVDPVIHIFVNGLDAVEYELVGVIDRRRQTSMLFSMLLCLPNGSGKSWEVSQGLALLPWKIFFESSRVHGEQMIQQVSPEH